MEGLTRAEVDKAESKDFALGGKPLQLDAQQRQIGRR